MGRFAGMASALVVAAFAGIASIAPAATDEGAQPFPRASLHVAGQEQRGRLLETSFTQPANEDLCVTQGAIGDGRFPRALEVAPDRQRLRFKVNAENRPDSSLRYWTELDENRQPVGEATAVPIEVRERKPNGDWVLVAKLDVSERHFLQLNAFWKGSGRCRANEFLVTRFAVRAGSL